MSELNTDKIIYLGKVVGISFEPANTNFKHFINVLTKTETKDLDPKISLIHESGNKYDKNAVAVIASQSNKSFRIGYIPKGNNEEIINIGIDKVDAKMVDFNEMDDEVVGLTICVYKESIDGKEIES